MRRRDPPTRYLTGLAVKPLSRDLRPMLIQTHHDRHHVPPRVEHRARATFSPTHRIPWVTVGPSQLRMTGRAAGTRARLQRTSFDTAGRPPFTRPPRPTAHAIFGVNAGTTPAPTVRPRGGCRSSDSCTGSKRSGAVALIDGAGARPSPRISSRLDDEERSRESTASIRSSSGDRARRRTRLLTGDGSVSKHRRLSLCRPSGHPPRRRAHCSVGRPGAAPAPTPDFRHPEVRGWPEAVVPTELEHNRATGRRAEQPRRRRGRLGVIHHSDY